MLKTFRLINEKVEPWEAENIQVYMYVNPDEKEKTHLIDLLIDKHTMSSALDPHELARIEIEADHTAAIVKIPKKYSSGSQLLLRPISAGLFLFPGKLIIILSEENLSWQAKAFSKVTSIQDLFLKIIFHWILLFEEDLRMIHAISEELESKISKAFSNENLIDMFQIEKNLVYYQDAIDSNGKVMEVMKLNTAKLGLSAESHEFLVDMIIENNQCDRQARFFAEVLSNLMDAWASIINNNLNIRIKMLTILSIAITIPTFVVSIFSVNLPLPIPQQGTLMSFWIVMVIAFGSMLATLGAFFYKKM